MDLEQTKQAIMDLLSKRHPLTIKYLSKTLGESRKKVKFVLTHNNCFNYIYRNPSNTYYRRRPVWFLKLTEQA